MLEPRIHHDVVAAQRRFERIGRRRIERAAMAGPGCFAGRPDFGRFLVAHHAGKPHDRVAFSSEPRLLPARPFQLLLTAGVLLLRRGQLRLPEPQVGFVRHGKGGKLLGIAEPRPQR